MAVDYCHAGAEQATNGEHVAEGINDYHLITPKPIRNLARLVHEAFFIRER